MSRPCLCLITVCSTILEVEVAVLYSSAVPNACQKGRRNEVECRSHNWWRVSSHLGGSPMDNCASILRHRVSCVAVKEGNPLQNGSTVYGSASRSTPYAQHTVHIKTLIAMQGRSLAI